VLTVNGNPVLTRAFDADCVDWDVNANDAGFDFLTIALRSGNVYWFELCGERVVRVPTIVAVQYIGELDAVAVVTPSVTIHLVPMQVINDTPRCSDKAFLSWVIIKLHLSDKSFVHQSEIQLVPG
jgi:hypothetical protein